MKYFALSFEKWFEISLKLRCREHDSCLYTLTEVRTFSDIAFWNNKTMPYMPCHSCLSHIREILKWNSDCERRWICLSQDIWWQLISCTVIFKICTFLLFFFLPKAMVVNKFTPKARFSSFDNKELFRLNEVKYQHKRFYMNLKKHSIVIFESQVQDYHSHQTSDQKTEFSNHPILIAELINSEVVIKKRKISWFEITLLDSRKH